tara:strand:+ start:350 stop:616 length:267 start_codon:yes stop_codon:yes gene_type:complete
MNYYSIQNAFLVAVCVKLDYIATLSHGTLKSMTFKNESLLAELCVDIGDEIQESVFESLMTTSSSSKEAEELVIYFKTKENIKDGNIS